MAVLRVIKNYPDNLMPTWRAGDTIEAFGIRVQELVDQGIAIVVVPDAPVKKTKKAGV